MVATRRKAAEALGSGSDSEKEDQQDADFTAKHAADTRDSDEEPESSDDDDEPIGEERWLYEAALADARKSPPGPLAKFLRGFFAAGSYFERGWNKSKGLPAPLKAALKEQEHPFETCEDSHGYVLDFAVACKGARLMYPGPGEGFTLNTWCCHVEDFAAAQKDNSAGRRRAGELRKLARAARRVLGASSEVGKGNATYPAPKVCPLCVATADELLDKYGVDELTFNDYFRLTRAGKVTVINKRKLYRDHLELSTLFRGWLCNFCNAKKIPLLDARTTAQYKLYQGRLYVNCTTFPSP